MHRDTIRHWYPFVGGLLLLRVWRCRWKWQMGKGGPGEEEQVAR